ncbi:MAG: DNA-binding beta-propeller fold protein YncE, partial [Myxococcota bacterium]
AGVFAVGLLVFGGCITEPDPTDQYGACPGRSALDSAGPGPSNKADAVFAPTTVDLRLEIDDAAWATLQAVREQCSGLRRCEDVEEGDPQACCAPALRKTYVPAVFRLGDDPATTAADIRLKGNPRDWKPHHKHQFIIRFNKTADASAAVGRGTGRLLGLRRLNLDANPADESLIRNNIGMRVMRESGIPAPRTNHARLWVNGQLFGLYENIEAVDKEFLESRFADPEANLYKHGDITQLKTNESAADHAALLDFWDAFANGPDWLFGSLDCLVDVNGLIRVMAAEAVLPASDNVWADDFNYYLYMDPRGGASVIPWDLDDVAYHNAGWSADLFSLQGLRENDPVDPGKPGEFWRDMQANSAWRARFLSDVASILDDTYRNLPQFIDARCCALREDIVLEDGSRHPWRETSSYEGLQAFEDECGRLLQRVRCRTRYLDAVLAGQAPPTECGVSTDDEAIPVEDRISCAGQPVGGIGDFAINEVSSETDRVELVNRGATAAWLAGWTLAESATPANADKRPVTPRFVLPGDFVVIEQVESELSLDSTGALYLFDPTGAERDSVSWCQGGADPSWCRLPDGSGIEGACTAATFGASNQASDGALVVPLLTIDAAGSESLDPERLAFAPDGTLWLTEPDESRLRAFDGAELVGTIEGVTKPEGLAVHGTRVYVVDRDEDQIEVYDEATFALVDTIAVPVSEDIRGLAIDAAGRIYLADNDNGLVVIIDGTAVTALNPVLSGGLALPDVELLALDATGQRLFAASPDTPRIDTFDLIEGTWLADAHVGALQTGETPEPGRVRQRVSGLAVDAVAGALFVVDRDNDRIMLHDLDSGSDLYASAADFGFRAAFGSHGSGCAELSSPRGLAIADGRLALADDGNNRVLIYDLARVYSALWPAALEP